MCEQAGPVIDVSRLRAAADCHYPQTLHFLWCRVCIFPELPREAGPEQAERGLTVQILRSRQVDDTMHHLPGVLPELPQVLAQRLVVQPLLQNMKGLKVTKEGSGTRRRQVNADDVRPGVGHCSDPRGAEKVSLLITGVWE